MGYTFMYCCFSFSSFFFSLFAAGKGVVGETEIGVGGFVSSSEVAALC